jgi:hypothetical protein
MAWFPKKPVFHEKKPLFNDRNSVSRATLESAITEAVKRAGPDCEPFVGVIIKRETPKSQYDANWAIRGVRFGRADQDKSSKAMTIIVERMQREFNLSEAGDAEGDGN